MWVCYSARLQYDWELFGPIQLRIINLFNDKRPVELKSISPYHSVIENVRENEEAKRVLEGGYANIIGGTFSDMKQTLLGLKG